MVAAELRIRLEGRVEELEGALITWEQALRAARRREFGPAARQLERGETSLSAHGDAGLEALLARQVWLRRAVERVVSRRLRLLGMPAVDLSRGARWLRDEPVLYEHRRLTPAFLVRALPLAAWLIGFTTVLAAWLRFPLMGVVVGLILLALAARWQGWSHVVLTPRRLVLEGDVIDLTDADEVVIIRTFMEVLALRCQVEVRRRSGRTQHASVRLAPEGLRAALRKRGIGTREDWGAMTR